MAMPDYVTRAREYGIATRDEVLAVLANNKNDSESSTTAATVILMDVRTADEIATDGRINPQAGTTHQKWVHVTDCTPDACPSLSQTPHIYVDLDQDAAISSSLQRPPPNIIVYCKSGRRARMAQKILLGHKTYGTVLNAGGYADIKDLFE